MKKRFFASSVLLLLLNFVSAAENSLAEGLGKGMTQIIGVIEGLLGPLFSAILGGGESLMFEKIIFLIIIFCVVYLVVKSMPVFSGKGPIILIVSISVSLLATRFMSGDLLLAVILPYNALGVAITAILPLFILFQFLMNAGMPAVGRKIGWAFYIVVFVTLWSTRYSELQIVANIYMGGAILAFLFLLFDGTIKNKMAAAKAEKAEVAKNALDRANLQEKISKIKQNEHLTPEEKDNLIRPLNRTLKKWYKMGGS